MQSRSVPARQVDLNSNAHRRPRSICVRAHAAAIPRSCPLLMTDCQNRPGCRETPELTAQNFPPRDEHRYDCVSNEHCRDRRLLRERSTVHDRRPAASGSHPDLEGRCVRARPHAHSHLPLANGSASLVTHKNYQTSSTVPASGMIGIGTLSPGDKSAVWLAGDEADLSTAVDTQRMYLVSASGLLAWSGLSSGLAMNRFNTS